MSLDEKRVMTHQPDAAISQANPVSGTKYTVLDTVKNARIISIAVWVTWTVQPAPLEIHITIDGIALTCNFTSPVSTTPYSVQNVATDAGFILATPLLDAYRAFLLEGRSIKVEAEITGGTVSNLSARVKYARLI